MLYIIASSNTRDIIDYCSDNDIAYLTTLDIFAIAMERELMTSDEVNSCINNITRRGSYLCCDKIKDHLVNHFDIIKYRY